MTVHVTVESCQGVIEEVRAYLSEGSAIAAEKKWKRRTGIRTGASRKARADDGTEFLIFEAELKP